MLLEKIQHLAKIQYFSKMQAEKRGREVEYFSELHVFILPLCCYYSFHFFSKCFCLSLLLKRRLKLPLWRFLSFIFCSLICENLAIYLQNLSVPKHHLWHGWLFAQLTSGKDLVLIRVMEMFFF